MADGMDQIDSGLELIQQGRARVQSGAEVAAASIATLTSSNESLHAERNGLRVELDAARVRIAELEKVQPAPDDPTDPQPPPALALAWPSPSPTTHTRGSGAAIAITLTGVLPAGSKITLSAWDRNAKAIVAGWTHDLTAAPFFLTAAKLDALPVSSVTITAQILPAPSSGAVTASLVALQVKAGSTPPPPVEVVWKNMTGAEVAKWMAGTTPRVLEYVHITGEVNCNTRSMGASRNWTLRHFTLKYEGDQNGFWGLNWQDFTIEDGDMECLSPTKAGSRRNQYHGAYLVGPKRMKWLNVRQNQSPSQALNIRGGKVNEGGECTPYDVLIRDSKHVNCSNGVSLGTYGLPLSRIQVVQNEFVGLGGWLEFVAGVNSKLLDSSVSGAMLIDSQITDNLFRDPRNAVGDGRLAQPPVVELARPLRVLVTRNRDINWSVGDPNKKPYSPDSGDNVSK